MKKKQGTSVSFFRRKKSDDAGVDTPNPKKVKKDKKPKKAKKRLKVSGKSKFGRKLTAILVLCFLLPSFVTGIVIFTQFKGYVQEDIYSNNESALLNLETAIENKINSVSKVATILSKVDYVQNMQPLLVKSMFGNVQEEFDLIQNIMVVDKDGKIIFSTDGVTGNTTESYVSEGLNDKTVFSDVIDIETPDGTKQVIKQVLPVHNRNGQVNGVLVVDISMDKFNLAIQSLEVTNGIEVLIVDNNGRLIADSNPDAFSAKTDLDFSQYTPFSNALKGEEGTLPYTFDGTRYLTSYKSIETLNLGVVTQIEEREALSHISTITFIFVGILIVLALVGFAVSTVLSNYVTRPLQRIADSALTASGGDFTVQVDEKVFKRKDEFGDLARAFMIMVEAFREIILRLKSSTDILDQTTETLVDSSEASRLALDDIVISTNNLKETAHDDIALSGKVVEGVEEMAKGSENVALNTEKLNILIKNNVDFASKGVDTMNITASRVQETFKSYESIESKIGSLEKSAVAIGGITDTIMEIANQTNLLALNAAIEAARAGDAGRGFAVVAGEIRNLADQSNKSAENITNIIKEIQGDIKDTSSMFKSTSQMLEEVVEGSEKSVNQITEILEDSRKAAESVDEISAVTEEQAASSAQINQMMDDMLETIKDTARTADNVGELIESQKVKNDETVTMIEEIKELSEELKSISGQFIC